MTQQSFRTYKLQVVVFFSFLALFSLIVAGIMAYGYRSNSEIMLSSSDELLYQISETVIGQTINHLDPARRAGHLLRRIIERGSLVDAAPELVEAVCFEMLGVYPQFSAVYLGDEGGNFIMSRRIEDGNFSTRILSRTSEPVGVLEIDRNPFGHIIATRTSSILNYDPRERPWYVLTKSQEQVVWSREYRLFTDQVPGITCAHPVFDQDNVFVGGVGIDFRLGELSEFLKSLKIGESGLAFITDSEGNVLAYPEKSGLKYGSQNMPRSPTQETLQSGWVKVALDEFVLNGRKRFTFSHADLRYIASFRSFPERFGRDWALAIIVPEDDFIGPIARAHETTLLFSFWLLVIGGFLTSAVSKELTSPIKSLTREAEKIKTLDFEGEIAIKTPVEEIHVMGEAMNSMKKALRAFKKYVPTEIVQGLVSNRLEARLEAQAKNITLMFTDIYDFCSITEEVKPAELMQQLSRYFDEITHIMNRHGGTIDKYIGDSVMAFWGAPQPDEHHAVHACKTALEVQAAVDILNQRWKDEGRRIFVTRIGINSGLSLVGNFGSSDRFNYTAVGDNVNLASRLEGLNKLYGSKIIASESVYEQAAEDFVFKTLDLVAVQGRIKKVKIFQLLCHKDDDYAEHYKKLADLYESAFQLYLGRYWRDAYEAYQQILVDYPEEHTAELFVDRCRQLGHCPPPDSWDGVFQIGFK